MSKYQKIEKLLSDLDFALTGKPKSGYQYPFDFLEFIQGKEYYLSDGGYSRIFFGELYGKLNLTDNSTKEVKEKWLLVKILIKEIEKELLNLIHEIEPNYKPYQD